MKKLTSILLVIIVLGLITGCGGKDNNASTVNKAKTPEKANVQTALNQLLSRDATEKEIIQFADQHIKTLKQKDANRLVLKLEETQKKDLDSQSRAFESTEIQETLIENQQQVFSDSSQFNTANASVNALWKDTQERGYKVICTEGMFYPIIDYAAYKPYKPYVTKDIKAYIDIMTNESEEATAEDNGIAISWDQLASRALQSESFVNLYPQSARFQAVNDLYNDYVSFYLYGANNSPAFDYQTQTLNQELLESYKNLIKDSPNSQLAQIILQYLPVLEKSNYLRTPEVDQFIKDALASLKP
ncbi:MAG: hypothetical protein ACM3MK_10840 [Chitinophagales bacterium]